MQNIIDRAYVHVPFCRSKCSYCAFYSIPIPEQDLIEKYLNKLNDDILKTPLLPLKSLYIGGGTPSYLTENQLEKLFLTLDSFCFEKDCEISIECNPESLTESKINLISSFANRISLGVESFNFKERKSIGREGSPDRVPEIIQLFNDKNITNISCDLIYGIPNQSEEDFIADLKMVLSMPVKHISAYSLTIEENSRLDGTLSPYQIEEIDDKAYEMWKNIPDVIRSRGFHRYEVSNYSIDSYKCKYNLSAWFGAKYLGFGPTAASFDGKDRWSNLELKEWLNGASPLIDSIAFYKRTMEIFAMGLRTCEKWQIKKIQSSNYIINSEVNVPFYLAKCQYDIFYNKLKKLETDKLIEIETLKEDMINVKSTELGLTFWNEIAIELI